MAQHRRRILRAGGLALAGVLPGCGGRGGSSGAEPSTGTSAAPTMKTTDPRTADDPGGTDGTRETTTGSTDLPPVGTTQSVEGGRVAVASVSVRDSVVLEGPEPFGVDAADGGRWVFADVTTEGVRIDPGALQLVTDADGYRGTVEVGALSLADFDEPYGRAVGPGDDDGWVAFRVPAPIRTDSARFVLGDAVWRLPRFAVDRLGSPNPTYELDAFRVPDAVDPGESVTVEFAVRNVGSRHGTFRAVAYATASSPGGFGNRAYERAIRAGSRETFVRRFDGWETFVDGGESDPGTVEVHLAIPGGEHTQSVALAGSTTGGG